MSTGSVPTGATGTGWDSPVSEQLEGEVISSLDAPLPPQETVEVRRRPLRESSLSDLVACTGIPADVR